MRGGTDRIVCGVVTAGLLLLPPGGRPPDAPPLPLPQTRPTAGAVDDGPAPPTRPRDAMPVLPDAAPRTRVMRFVEGIRRVSRSAAANASDQLEIVLEPPEGGKPLVFGIPNTDPTKFSPPPKALAMFRAFDPDTLLRVRFAADGRDMTVLGAYEPRPGENLSRGYVYRGTSTARVGKWTYTTIELTKFDTPVSLLIPNRTSADGGQVPDSRLMARAKSARPGEVVEVWSSVFNGMTFVDDLVPYTPRIAGTVVAPSTLPATTRAAAAIASTRPSVHIRLAEGGDVRTILLPATDQVGRPVDDPAALFASGALRVGRDVHFVTRTDPRTGEVVLRDLTFAGRMWRLKSAMQAQSGEAGFTFFLRRRTWQASFQTLSRDEPRTWFKVGLTRLLDGDEAARTKLAVSPEATKALRKIRGASDPVSPEELDEALRQFQQWRESAGPDREAAEQAIFRILQDATGRVRDADADRERVTRETLKPAQFDAVVELGKSLQ